MRISDWSSDVCSSDLRVLAGRDLPRRQSRHRTLGGLATDRRRRLQLVGRQRDAVPAVALHVGAAPRDERATQAVLGASFAADETVRVGRSEEHTSELQSLMRISYAVFCLKKKTSK